MNSIRAVAVDPGVPGRLTIREVASPTALPSQAIVRVAVISLHRGEVRNAQAAQAGARPGWDLAGTVEIAAGEGRLVDPLTPNTQHLSPQRPTPKRKSR